MNTQSQQLQNSSNRVQASAQDDISLIDMLLVLIRQKYVVLAVFVVCLLAGMFYVQRSPVLYEYGTSIEIGSRIVRDDAKPIDNPETVLAKIQESYIPLALHEYRQANPQDRRSYRIEASLPKRSEIIVLKGSGTTDSAETYIQILNAIVDKVRLDHTKIESVIRKEIEIKRSQLVNELNVLQDEENLIKADIGRIDSTKELIKSEIAQTEKLIQMAQDNRQDAVNEANDATKAMTLLMLDNELRASRDHLSRLKERLLIELADDRDKLLLGLSKNKQKQLATKENIGKFDIELENLQQTRAIVPPMQSNRPVSMKKKTAYLIALALSLLIAFFSAFIAEFLRRAKSEIVEQHTRQQA